MDLEFVEFYPMYGNPKTGLLVGTIHLYVTDWKVDIRGISFKRKPGVAPSVELVWLEAYELEERRPVKYPVISFVALEDQIKLTSFVMERMHVITKDYKYPRGLPKNWHQWREKSRPPLPQKMRAEIVKTENQEPKKGLVAVCESRPDEKE